MKKFAKLFECAELGQVLCIADSNNDDGEEELRFMFDPENEYLDVCSIAISSSTEGFAQARLEATTEEMAFNAVRKAKAEINNVLD